MIRSLVVAVLIVINTIKAQVTAELAPTKVLNLSSLFPDSKVGSIQIDQISMKGDNWAALIHKAGSSHKTPSVVAFGNATQEQLATVPAETREVWASFEGDVYLGVTENWDSRAIFKLPRADRGDGMAEPRKILEGSLIPKISGDGITWTRSKPAISDPDESVMQRRWIFAGVGGSSYLFGGVSERLVTLDSKGEVVSVRTIDLDSVYEQLGTPVKKSPINSGRNRTLWAEITEHEELLLGLSELSINDPVCVVRVNLSDGSIRNIYRLRAPVDSKNIDRYNLNGSAVLFHGSGDRALILADSQQALLVFYSLPFRN